MSRRRFDVIITFLLWYADTEDKLHGPLQDYNDDVEFWGLH